MGGSRRFGGLMQKAGEGREGDNRAGLDHEGLVGGHLRDVVLEQACVRAGKGARGCQEGGLLLIYP